MNALLQMGLSNAVVCGIMAALLLPVARWLARPALTHALCVLMLIKLITPPLVSVPVLRDAPPARAAAPIRVAPILMATPPAPAEAGEEDWRGPVDEASDPPPPAAGFSSSPPRAAASSAPARVTALRRFASSHWRLWLLACWIVSSVLLAVATFARIIQLELAVHRATVSGRQVTEHIEVLCRRLGIRRLPRVRFISGSVPPMLMGLWRRPELVIPADLWDRLDHLQRQTLLLHELAHLRRGDHRVRYVELLATWLYWWHPALWFTRAALRQAEEQCCDAWVVWAMPHSCRAYMTTLLDAIDFLSQRARPRLAASPALVSGMGQFHNLQRRLAMVREQNVQRRLSGRSLAVVALLAAVALPVGAKWARGDETAAQPGDTATAGKGDPQPGQIDTTSTALRDSDADLAGALPADQPGSDHSDPPDARTIKKLRAELEAARSEIELYRRQVDDLKGGSQPRGADKAGQISGMNAPLPAGGGPDVATAGTPDLPAAADPSRPAAAGAGTPANRRSTSFARPNHLPSLGHIVFTYQRAGSSGTVRAWDRGSKQLMWTLDIPLNSQSVIQCYDNDTLLIKSADGYTRLVTAEDGKVTKQWTPDAVAPAASPKGGVNPFGRSNARPDRNEVYPLDELVIPAPDTARVASPNSQDQEKRLKRIEQNIRQLTEAVNRLTRQQEAQPSSSAPAKS